MIQVGKKCLWLGIILSAISIAIFLIPLYDWNITIAGMHLVPTGPYM